MCAWCIPHPAGPKAGAKSRGFSGPCASSSWSRSPASPTSSAATTSTDLAELNRLFAAWVETVYHRTVHSETGQTPLARWSAGGPVALPAPEALTEAFLWEEHRRVTKTATVSLHGNSYEVDPALVGRKVELVFDPFDLTRIEVRLAGAPMGLAIPHHIGRHSHPKAKPETPTAPPKPTGIDYARLIETAHAAELARGVNYAALSGNRPDPRPARPAHRPRRPNRR